MPFVLLEVKFCQKCDFTDDIAMVILTNVPVRVKNWFFSSNIHNIFVDKLVTRDDRCETRVAEWCARSMLINN